MLDLTRAGCGRVAVHACTDGDDALGDGIYDGFEVRAGWVLCSNGGVELGEALDEPVVGEAWHLRDDLWCLGRNGE